MQDFNTLYQTHYAMVHRLVARLVGDGDVVKDLVQEVFVKLHLQLQAGETVAYPKTWLYRVAIHGAINHLSRTKQHLNIEEELMCLSEELIQQWIDGELSEGQQAQVNQHLANCELCRQKAQQQKALAFSIKNILQVEDVAIPEFRRSETATGEAGNCNDLPVKNNEFHLNNSTSVPEMKAVNAGPFSRTIRTVPLWLKIAAVLIPAFCLVQVLIQPDKSYQPTHDELLMYQSLSDMDANAAFQERVMVTTSTNQEGEIVDVEIR